MWRRGERMPTIKNGLTWADYVRRVFVPSLEFYRRVAMERFLPSLSDEAITEEANTVEKKAFERMGRSVSPEDYDPGDFVESAFDEGLEFYELMHDTRQGLLNGFAATLYHLFEQQLCQFYRLIAWDNKAVLSGRDAEERLRAHGIDVAKFPEWASLNELRLLANCVKHAEGNSCGQLAKLRPDLFERPTVGLSFKGPRPFVERPLSGEGVYFSVAEFDKMAGRLKRFWDYIANEISK
jgi:hypothetical protein